MVKYNFKKTLAGIFAVAIVASSIPLAPYTKVLDSISITASAAETEDGFIYAANDDGTLTITGYNGTGGDVVIPSTIGGAAVTAIGTKAFYQCDGINSITVPEGVLSIGTAQDELGVFEECSMQSISLPSTLLYIWPCAFALTQLTEITFPDSVIRIGDEVFWGCTELKSITAPCRTAAKEESWKPKECSPEITYNHVYEAGADVCVCGKTSYFEFDSAAGIISGYNGTNTSVKVPEKIDGIAVTAIADDAFSDCDFIETISAPCAVSGEWSKNCKAAVSHYNHVYAKGAAECNCGEASVYAYEENEDGTITLTRYFGGDSEVVVPAKLFGKTVSKVTGAFYHNGNITKVVISEGITCIDDSLFQGCGNLKEVVLPLSLKTIGMYVFCDCTGLESITIPENVETIGIQAFQYCSNLKEIHMLGKTPPETDWTAFWTECNSVESIYVPYGTEDDYAAFPLLFPREDVSEVPTIIHPPYPSATYVLGGKGENFTNSADSDMMLTEPEKPLADGYAFAGWYTDDTFTTKFDFTKGIDDDIKIYAKWEETATVIFDMQGNGTQIAPVSIVNGNTITEPEKPLADGYAFAGWYTDKDCTDGNLFDFSTQITDDITLYAKWTEQHTVTFDMQNHGTAISPITVNSGDKITEPDAPSETGYVFGGWYTDKDCTDSNLFDFNTQITDDITIYAKWEKTATVTFDMQGHGIAVAPITVKSGDKIEEPTVQNEDGYIFCGWGNNAAYDLPFDFSNEIIDDTVIYARWCPISSACGDNLMYKFDEASGEMTIYGDGTEMDDYSSKWPDYYGLPIKSIRFETDNLTTIGKFAFSCLSDVTDITIPASVTTINDYAFENCESLSMLTFEGDSVPVFNGNGVFKNCKPDVIYVPAGCLDAYKAVLVDYADQIQEIPTAEAKGNSVSYNGDVTINFHYLVSDSYKNGYVKFGDDLVVYVSEASIDKDGYYVFPISMSAKNMYDEITAQFYDEEGNAVGTEVEFYLEKYMDGVKAYDPNYSDFVDSFLEYGKQAAAYFGNTNAPASTKTYDYTSIISALETNGYDVLPDMGGNYVGATMLLKSKPILRLYYKEEVNGLDLGDNAKWDKNELNPDLTFIQKEISATNFDTTFNGYSVYHYFYKALGAGDEKLMKLCASLYEFSKAADAMGK